MKVTIQKAEFIQAIKAMRLVAERSSNKPILANCHLNVSKGSGTFTGTDYQTTIIFPVTCKTVEPGVAVFNVETVWKTRETFKGDSVTLETDDGQRVKIGNLSLPMIEPGLYPTATDTIDPRQRYVIRTDDFKRIVSETLFACQKNETRRNLMGLHLDPANSWLQVTTTDGHRLAQTKAEIETGKDNADHILPRAGAAIICKVLEIAKAKPDVLVTSHYDAKTAIYRFHDIVIHSRLVEDKFPNVDSIIPKDNPSKLTVDRVQLMGALKIIAAMSTDKFKPVGVAINAGSMVLGSEPGENGVAREAIPIHYDGEPITIVFNAVYLLDVLRISKADSVTLGFDGSLNPLLVTFPNNPCFQGVVMPLRIEWNSTDAGTLPESTIGE